MKGNNDNFLQPIISIFGLAVSIVGTLLPILNQSIAAGLFVSSAFILPSSLIAFVLGIAIIWQVIEFQPYIQWNFGKFQDRGKGFNEYWLSIGPNKVFWIIVIIDIITASLFILIKIFASNLDNLELLQFAQFLLYIMFFLLLTLIFSLLFAQTKQRFLTQEKQDNFPFTVFETLEKNRIIKPGIEIYENTLMEFKDLLGQGVKTWGIGRKMRVKTTQQEEEVIEFIISENGKELLKVLKKEHI